MRILPTLSALLLLPVFAGAEPVDSPDNLIGNGGFEQWQIVPAKDIARRLGQPYQFPILVEDLTPDGFRLNCELGGDPPGVTIARDSEERHSGEYSARIQNHDGAQKGSINTKEIPIQPSTRYKLSFWYKMQEVEGNGVCVWISHGPKQSFWSNRKSSHHRPPESRGSSDWMRYEVEFETLPDSENSLFTLQLQNALGTVWFDDFTVMPLGPVQKEEM